MDALALEADEGRDKQRYASGSSKYALIRRCPNGETRHDLSRVILRGINIRSEGIPRELKHLST